MQFIRIKIPYINDEKKAKSFLGKNVIYLKKINNDKKIRWGKIVALHGRSGAFLVKFKKNINPNNLEYKLIVAPFPF
jgi:ribosomal protein L35AE/L33A